MGYSFLKKYAFLAVSICAISVALFFFGKIFYQTWGALEAISLSINYSYVISSVLLCLTGFFTMTLGYYIVIKSLGIEMPFKKAAKARAFSEIGGYVPGKVWTLLTRMHYSKHWMNKAEVIASSSIEIASLILSSIFAFVIISIIQPGIFSEYSIIFYIALPLCLIMMHPKILSFCLNIGLKIFKKESISLKISYKNLLIINIIYAFYWLFSGISIFLLINAVYPLSWAYLPYLILVYAVAWTVGFLSVIFPAGLGLREGILVYMLGAYMPVQFTLVAAVVFRCVTLLAQFILALIFSFA